MNYKLLIIIALALCLCLVATPVAAVWQNGNWVTAEEAANSVHDSVTGVDSKYVATSAVDKDLMSNSGLVYGNLKSGQVLEGGERFLMSRDGSNTSQEYKFSKDGLFSDYFAPGEYTVTLPQGTGSASGIYSEENGFVGNLHPEVTHVTVAAGQISYFTFIGNSIGAGDKKVLRADPLDVSIRVWFGCNDINVKNIRFVQISGVMKAIDNPNHEPVDAAYKFDIHYFV